MSIIFLLIGISLLVALTFLGGFLWAVRTGQYEDDYTPAVRMLFDDGIVQDAPPKAPLLPDNNQRGA
jgi:cbb3-type cytochrome oxidase maturation protein